jgi:hypothetical protein
MNQGIQPEDVAEFAGDYFVAVRNPRWVNAEHTQIDCEVNFRHVDFEEWTPFCADPDDYMPYSSQIFNECAAGTWGVVTEYTPPIEDIVVAEATEAQPVVNGAQTL